MIGLRFGRLTVTALVTEGGRLVECRCDCGVIKTYRAGDLRRSTKSCGCWASDRMRNRNTTHGATIGHRPSREWITWRSMHQRCEDQKHKSWSRYGGRGITVCPEWATFEQFFADMGAKPAGLQLERIDNSKGYSKDNCAWATRSAQARNRREQDRLSDGTFAPAGSP